jgi:hypothetical protein
MYAFLWHNIRTGSRFAVRLLKFRRHSGACEARTRNLEIPGSMLRVAPE